MNPEQIERRVDQAVTVYNRAFKTHAAEVVKARKDAEAARAETRRLTEALDAERAKTVTLEKRIREQELETDLTARQHFAKIEGAERWLQDLDQALGQTITRTNWKPKRQTVVRDEVGRVTEVIIETEGSDTATVRRILRDANQRIVGAEEYQVPHEDQTGDES
jgi:hypothetical protein